MKISLWQKTKSFRLPSGLSNMISFFFNKFVQLFHSNNGYISLDDASSWLINTRQGLCFPLYKGFVTTFQYNYDYNNNPSPDAESKWDSKFYSFWAISSTTNPTVLNFISIVWKCPV
jgi:hypothetical protein